MDGRHFISDGHATGRYRGSFRISLATALANASVVWRGLLIGVGVGALFASLRLWAATAERLELTAHRPCDDNGPLVARVEDIRAASHSTSAFKPSNGFVLRLIHRAPAAWALGLWSRVGHSVGIGGVTSPASGKIMAEPIAALIAKR